MLLPLLIIFLAYFFIKQILFPTREKILGAIGDEPAHQIVDHVDTFVSIREDHIRLGTWVTGCGKITIVNDSGKTTILKSSRWWGDSDTFIENLRILRLGSNESTVQNYGWAGFGAKEYRVYFEDEQGNRLSTRNFGIVADKFLCNDSNTLGLN